MAQFAPIDYGSAVSPNTSGVRAMEGAVEEHGARLVSAERAAGAAGEQTAGTYVQNVLHRQAVEAMTKAAEGTEKALNTIETNPYYISRDTLASSSDPETADKLWSKATASGSIIRDDEGHEFVPTHVVGRDLYDSMAKTAREEAAKNISLPGWRGEFLKTAETEALNKKERWLDPKLASMQVAFDRSATLSAANKAADAAVTPEGFDLPIHAIKTSPSFSPQEKEAKIAEYKSRQDTVIIDKAMTNPVANEEVLRGELNKLQNPEQAKAAYPNHDEAQRAELAHHVMTGIKMAELQKSEQLRAQKEADKNEDDTRTLGLVKGLVTKGIDPKSMFDQAGVEGSSAQQIWTGYKTREGIENAYRVTESFVKNQEAKKEHDTPGAFAALTQIYREDPQEFVKRLFSNKKEVTPFGTYNFAKDLSQESMKHFMEKAAGMADKERSQEDRVKEESVERRLAVAMTSHEGGGVSRATWANPQSRVEYSEHEQYVRDALTTAEKLAAQGGKHLTPEQETDVMLKAAHEFAVGTEGRLFGSNPADGINIQTARGRVNLPLSERTAMAVGRQAAGHVGSVSFQQDGADYFDHYKDMIDNIRPEDWKAAGSDKPMTPAEKYQMYYEAKKLAYSKTPVTDPAEQVAFLMQALTRANAVKKSGGTK